MTDKELGFEASIMREDLAGQNVAASFTEDGRNVRYHDFREVQPPNNWGNP
jgi:hypothetical protein